MIRSMTRSGIKTYVHYTSMLAGNEAYPGPIIPSTYFAGESGSTQINKMPFSTETFSTLSATLTLSTGYTISSMNSANKGYAIIPNATNKCDLVTDTNATSTSVHTGASNNTSLCGIVPGTSGSFVTNATTTVSNSVLVTMAFSNDSFSSSTALQSVSSGLGLSPYTLSTEGTSIYFGGGPIAGTYYYGGIVQYFSNTNTASQVYPDANSRASSQTAGANNGSTAGYIAGGTTMPYITYTSRIMKLVYSTNILSTISGTLTSNRAPVRTGIQKNVCAYYAGGRQSSASTAVSLTTVEKFVFSTETSSNLASASVNRDGYGSWNTY